MRSRKPQAAAESSARTFSTTLAGIAGLALLCSIALPRLPALAAAKPSLAPQAVGDKAFYNFTSTTQTPRGNDLEDGTFSLVRGARSGFEIDVTPTNGLAQTFQGALQKDGTIDLIAGLQSDDPGPFVLQRYNQVATILMKAPPALKTGDSWKATITVPLPHTSVDVPVIVRVSNATDDGSLDLEAIGDIKTTVQPQTQNGPGGSSSSGQLGSSGNSVGSAGSQQGTVDNGIPIVVALRTAAHFNAGILSKADGTMRSTLQLREPIDIISNWTIAVPTTATPPP